MYIVFHKLAYLIYKYMYLSEEMCYNYIITIYGGNYNEKETSKIY